MLFNILSCSLVWVVSLIVYAAIFSFLEKIEIIKLNGREDRSLIMHLSVYGTLVDFIWVMTFNNWWR